MELHLAAPDALRQFQWNRFLGRKGRHLLFVSIETPTNVGDFHELQCHLNTGRVRCSHKVGSLLIKVCWCAELHARSSFESNCFPNDCLSKGILSLSWIRHYDLIRLRRYHQLLFKWIFRENSLNLLIRAWFFPSCGNEARDRSWSCYQRAFFLLPKR